MADAFRKPAGDADDPRERTRLRIIAAATSAFVRYGYRRASIDEIAKSAGVGKGTIYLYYDSKRELFLAAIAEEKATLSPELAKLAQLPPEARLEHVLRISFRFALTAPLAASLLRREHAVAELFDDVGPDLWTRQAEVSRTFFADMFDPERRLPDAEREAIAATLSMMSLLLPHAHEPALGEVSLLTFGDTLAALLARGVAR